MPRELTATVAIVLAWLAVVGATYSVLGIVWAIVVTLPFLPFIYGIGREWRRARRDAKQRDASGDTSGNGGE